MSSHHIVRDQQEPALFLIKDDDLTLDVLGGLLEWVPTVVTTSDTFPLLAQLGMKVDCIVSQGSLSDELLFMAEEQQPIQILDSGPSDSYTAVLNYLSQSGHRAVNLVGFDHQKADLLQPFHQLLDLVIFDGPIRYFPVRHRSVEKWMPAGSVQLHGRENSLVEVSDSSGSKIYPIKHATFVEVAEGLCCFQGTELFWVGEFLQ